LSKLIHDKKHDSLAKGWSTTLSSVLREDFVLQDEWATGHVTLEDAASHRTGMARHDKSSMREADGKQLTPRDIVRNLRNLPMTAEPRVTFYYCNLMYVTLSHVLETVTGNGLGRVLRDLIWDPLGMKSTFLDLDEAKGAEGHLADGYYWDKESEEYKWVDYLGVGEISGAGGAFSTVLDYAKWVRCLLLETEPLSGDVHKDIKKPRSIGSAAPGGGLDISLYSLGWQRTLYKGHVVYTHGGGMHAYGSQVYWLPDAKFGVVAFGNTAWTSNAVEDVVIYRLIGNKLGIPEEDQFDFGKTYVPPSWLPFCFSFTDMHGPRTGGTRESRQLQAISRIPSKTSFLNTQIRRSLRPLRPRSLLDPTLTLATAQLRFVRKLSLTIPTYGTSWPIVRK
jgi:CubicO group peptidase (beta-lactamase class C family)